MHVYAFIVGCTAYPLQRQMAMQMDWGYKYIDLYLGMPGSSCGQEIDCIAYDFS
jgi:hypothetical protein